MGTGGTNRWGCRKAMCAALCIIFVGLRKFICNISVSLCAFARVIEVPMFQLILVDFCYWVFDKSQAVIWVYAFVDSRYAHSILNFFIIYIRQALCPTLKILQDLVHTVTTWLKFSNGRMMLLVSCSYQRRTSSGVAG